MNSINWAGPLEAVHEETGKTVPMIYKGPWMGKMHETETCPDPSRTNEYWETSGANGCTSSGWHIRNVQPTPSATKVDDTLVERMVALVRAMEPEGLPQREWRDEARAIATLLPIPTDPDLVKAREIAAQGSPSIAHLFRKGTLDDAQNVQNILAGIKYGRGA